MHRVTIFLMLIILLLSNISISNVESEPLQDFYSDKRTFDYMDICNIYPTFNLTNDRQMADIQDHEDITSYETLVGGNELIPHKTIYFTDDYLTNSILLISKMVYNFSANDEFTINLYYSDSVNTSIELTYFYNDYITTVATNNLTNNYSYVTNGLKEFSTVNQSVTQRHSLLSNVNSTNNLYDDYRKRTTVDNGDIWLDVLNITIKDTIRLKTNEWVKVKISRDNFLWNESVFNSFHFINFGLVKNEIDHELLVNEIQISNKVNVDGYTDKPFMEYYEFKELTSNDSTDRPLFHIDLVEDNYQVLTVHPLELWLNTDNELEFYYDDVLEWTSPVEFYPYDESTEYYFCGYQINIQKDDIGYYHVYLYYKWFMNSRRDEPVNPILWNYSSVKLSIMNEKFIYLCNFEYYDDTNNTDIDISYLQNSHKWDIVDNAIRHIDRDESGVILLVQNVDSTGFTVPSIEDLKKAFTDKIVNPLTSTLNKMSTDLLKPINELKDDLDAVISDIQAIKSKIDTTITTISNGFSSISSTMTTEFGDLETYLGSEFTSVTNAISGVTTAVNQVKSAVDDVTASVDNVKTSIDTIVGDVSTIATDLSDSLSELQSIVSDLGDIITTLDIGGTIYDLINSIVTDVDWIITNTTDLIAFMSTVLMDMGATLDLLWDLTWGTISDSYDLLTTFLSMSWMLIGVVFMYRLIFAMQRFADSGDLNDITEVIEVFYSVALFIYTFLRMIVNFIGGIIP